jgi:3-oxo-5-alpha-steroid 4-dehydrogenase 3
MNEPDWSCKTLVAAVPSLSPAQWLQISFVLPACITLGVTLLPRRARAYLLTYGPRADKSKPGTQVRQGTKPPETSRPRRCTDNPERNNPERENHANPARPPQDQTDTDAENVRPKQDNHQDDWFTNLVALSTSWGQIPHSWFGGFYIVSLACSVFWLVQYVVDGRILHFLASRQAAASEPGMEPGQVVLVWSMMFLQGARRALESLLIVKSSSKSTMWIIHWLLGHVFYIVMSMAVWIEGSGRTSRCENAP